MKNTLTVSPVAVGLTEYAAPQPHLTHHLEHRLVRDADAGDGGGALHLGDGAHRAVEAEGAQGATEVEAGDAGLVDRLGRLEGERPLGDRGRVVAERRALDLPGHGVQGAGLDAAGVDVETDGCDIIGHGAPPPSHVARGHGWRYDHCRPTHDRAARGGAPNVQLISSVAFTIIATCRPLI